MMPMPRKTAKKRPLSDDEIIQFIVSCYNQNAQGISPIEKTLLAVELDVKFDEDVRYLRATAALQEAFISETSKDGKRPPNFEEIRNNYSRLGDIPEKFKGKPEDYYSSLLLRYLKQKEIKEGAYDGYG